MSSSLLASSVTPTELSPQCLAQHLTGSQARVNQRYKVQGAVVLTARSHLGHSSNARPAICRPNTYLMLAAPRETHTMQPVIGSSDNLFLILLQRAYEVHDCLLDCKLTPFNFL